MLRLKHPAGQGEEKWRQFFLMSASEHIPVLLSADSPVSDSRPVPTVVFPFPTYSPAPVSISTPIFVPVSSQALALLLVLFNPVPYPLFSDRFIWLP